MAALASPPPAQRAFVGRSAELGRLDDLLQRALAGAGQVALVGGEPGAGKTVLVHEFTRRAQQRHPELVIAFGDCSATSAASDAYLPFREILGLLTGDIETSLAEGTITDENASRLRRIVGKAGDIVVDYGGDLVDVFVPGAGLVAKVGRRLARRFTGPGRPAAPVRESALADPARVLQQFTNVVRRLSDEQPLVLVVDDAHWADRSSIDLIFHLARRIEGSRLLLLVTYRSNEVLAVPDGDRHPLLPVLNEIRRYYGDATIDLDDEASGDRLGFVNRLIDAQPNALPIAFRDELFRHTQGHPLFTVELLQTLRERGTLVRDDAGVWRLSGDVEWDLVPGRSEGIIAERVGRLPAAARDLLAIASVEGDQFTAQIVARVAGLDARAVIRTLGDIERQHQLIHAQGVQKIGGERAAAYRFRHELFRAYVYGTLDAVQRSEFHFAVAEALETLHEADRAAAAPVLAQHFEHAGEIERAIVYLQLAGDAAARRHAQRQAIELWQRALTLGHDTLDAHQRMLLLEKSGSALRLVGAFDDARALLARALDLAGDDLDRARVLRKIGACLVDQHRLEDADRYLEQARAAVPPHVDGDESIAHERVQLLLDRAWAQYWQNVPMDALLAEGNDYVDRHGTADDHARWGQMRVLLRLRAERYRPTPPTLALADRQLEAGRGAHGTTYAQCAFLHGFTYLWTGRQDVAERSIAEAVREAEKYANRLTLMFALTYTAVLWRLRGEFERTETAAATAEAAARESNMVGYVAAARANRAWAAFQRGDAQQEQTLAECLGVWQQNEVTYPFRWLAAWPLAAIRLGNDRLADALAAIESALEPGQQPPPAPVADAAARARDALVAGDDAAARSHLERVLDALRTAREL